MKEFTTYSPAMLKTFELCKRKFEYKYIKGITIPVDTFKMQQGKNIHALANYYLKNFNIDKLENALTDNEKFLWNNLKNTKYFQYEVVNSEYTLTSKIDNYWISGRLDALVKNNKDYYILDYKTGRIPNNPEFDYQTIIYLLMVDNLIKDYGNLYFVYVDLNENNTKEIKFTDELKIEYQKKLVNILNDVEKSLKLSVYPKCKECKACEYTKLCEGL